ncbi:SDR family NAD(P)-dependent oxidoreductase, partial [Algoriphagus sp. PAP.12]|uniref:SDR family NAD(P)-dependent oxidoreductase n=1 Tax=Algoriphagus sp. PAP.12 TaxID=2996678 RepID=UPI00227ADE26
MSKTILITGASSGIGKATAKKFQAKGWNVIATMRNPEKETELSSLENVFITKLDVQDLTSIASAIEEGIDKFGKIDVLLNNAGYAILGTFESASRESITRQFDV